MLKKVFFSLYFKKIRIDIPICWSTVAHLLKTQKFGLFSWFLEEVNFTLFSPYLNVVNYSMRFIFERTIPIQNLEDLKKGKRYPV
uniref:Uncharacterized protein n=1 Tax=Lepeophtheirus salmonis TaxID=72036 RepID=A0A0K2UNF8_LEPSM